MSVRQLQLKILKNYFKKTKPNYGMSFLEKDWLWDHVMGRYDLIPSFCEKVMLELLSKQ